MTEQPTESIRLAAMDQYIIDREIKHKQEIFNLRASRRIWIGLAITALIGMFTQFYIARECLQQHPIEDIKVK